MLSCHSSRGVGFHAGSDSGDAVLIALDFRAWMKLYNHILYSTENN